MAQLEQRDHRPFSEPLVLLLYRILKDLAFFEKVVCKDMYSEFDEIKYRARGNG